MFEVFCLRHFLCGSLCLKHLVIEAVSSLSQFLFKAVWV